jgi:hypothetical protein
VVQEIHLKFGIAFVDTVDTVEIVVPTVVVSVVVLALDSLNESHKVEAHAE